MQPFPRPAEGPRGRILAGGGSASVPRRIQLSMNRLRSLSGDLTSGYSRRDISFIRSIPIRRLSPGVRRRRRSTRGRRKSIGRWRRDSGRCQKSSGRSRRGSGRYRRAFDGRRRGAGRCRRDLFGCRRDDVSCRPADCGEVWGDAGGGRSVYLSLAGHGADRRMPGCRSGLPMGSLTIDAN